MNINRTIASKIEEYFFKGKAIIIYGARQVGKTTLVKALSESYPDCIYLNCDEPDVADGLSKKTSTELKYMLNNTGLLIIDEAQRVKDIGITLKLMVDNFAGLQIVATGSSSFELSNSIMEPLTGRKYEFHLFGFSIAEIRQIYSDLEINRLIEQFVIYGMYPEIITKPKDREINLKSLADSYLFKDILVYERIRNHDVLRRLLQALALQIGSEVSYAELAGLLGIDKKTVESYIEILEKAFIIFRLYPYSANVRNELKKKRKVFFYDTGIRNAIINNFNPSHLRNDWGGLWENFIIAERLKYLKNNFINCNTYFWRNSYKQEVDLIELMAEDMRAFEIKWKAPDARIPRSFMQNHKNAQVSVINSTNFLRFLSEK